MTTAYEIPFDNSTAQTFLIPLAGTVYKLAISWCQPHACWMLDVMTAEGAPLIMGTPVITGVDLLRQHKSVGIQGQLFAQSAGDPYRVPDFTALGESGFVFFVTEP